MKQTLQLKLSQHLTLTPQLQQSIRLLQLSTIELNAEVERMLQDNPMLERTEGDEDEAGTTAPVPIVAKVADTATAATPERESAPEQPDSPYEPGEDWSGVGSGARFDDDDDALEPQTAASISLRDHLAEQLSCTKLSERDRQLVAVLIGQHHRLRCIRSGLEPEIVEAFRRADLVDVCAGVWGLERRAGLDPAFPAELAAAFPYAGFHGTLLRTALRWILRHPLRPLPMLRW